MAPILIDNRGILKLGFMSLLTLLIVFSAGFLSGLHRAGEMYVDGTHRAELELPVIVVSEHDELEPQLPTTVTAGEEIDVDRPVLNSATEDTHTGVHLIEKVAKKKVATVSELSDEEKTSAASSIKTSIELAKEKSIEQSIKTPIATNKVTLQDEAVANTVAGAEDNTKDKSKLYVKPETGSAVTKNIRYTVQVGMYGRSYNAENMVSLLKTQGVDAYVSEFSNSKNNVRYNVRFGYFSDKHSALSALKQYKADHKGEGYLVNFSKKDLRNVADAEKKVKQVKEKLESRINELTPEVKTNAEEPIRDTTTTSTLGHITVIAAHN